MLRYLALEEDVAIAIVAAGALPPLVELLSSRFDAGTRKNAATALMMLAGRNKVIKAAVVAAGAIPPLVELLRGGSNEAELALQILAV
jgi:HEAT repeat protein